MPDRGQLEAMDLELRRESAGDDGGCLLPLILALVGCGLLVALGWWIHGA